MSCSLSLSRTNQNSLTAPPPSNVITIKYTTQVNGAHLWLSFIGWSWGFNRLQCSGMSSRKMAARFVLRPSTCYLLYIRGKHNAVRYLIAITGPQRTNIFALDCQHQATVPSFKMYLTWTVKSHQHEHSIKYAYLWCPCLIPKWTI